MAEQQARTVLFVSAVEPAETGSGAQVRACTLLRMYQRIGFGTHCVVLRDGPTDEPPDFSQDVLVHKRRQPSLSARLLFRLFRLSSASVIFPSAPEIAAQVNILARRIRPEFLHLEYLAAGQAALAGLRAPFVFGCNDLQSKRRRLTGDPSPSPRTARYRARLDSAFERLEKRILSRSRLVLAISETENCFLRTRWSIQQSHHLPMSWPNEDPISSWPAPGVVDGQLHLLHLGPLDGFIGLQSLRYLLGEALPQLEPALAARTTLRLVGQPPEEETRISLQEQAPPGMKLEFAGFIPDLRSEFARAHLQVVAAKEATGVRTRIVESFVRGLPVLSTPAATSGLSGLRHGTNILIADSPRDFAALLAQTATEQGLLRRLAIAGRSLYDAAYSMASCSERLGALLQKYLSPDEATTGPHAPRW